MCRCRPPRMYMFEECPTITAWHHYCIAITWDPEVWQSDCQCTSGHLRTDIDCKHCKRLHMRIPAWGHPNWEYLQIITHALCYT